MCQEDQRCVNKMPSEMCLVIPGLSSTGDAPSRDARSLLNKLVAKRSYAVVLSMSQSSKCVRKKQLSMLQTRANIVLRSRYPRHTSMAINHSDRHSCKHRHAGPRSRGQLVQRLRVGRRPQIDAAPNRFMEPETPRGTARTHSQAFAQETAGQLKQAQLCLQVRSNAGLKNGVACNIPESLHHMNDICLIAVRLTGSGQIPLQIRTFHAPAASAALAWSVQRKSGLLFMVFRKNQVHEPALDSAFASTASLRLGHAAQCLARRFCMAWDFNKPHALAPALSSPAAVSAVKATCSPAPCPWTSAVAHEAWLRPRAQPSAFGASASSKPHGWPRIHAAQSLCMLLQAASSM